MFPVLLQLGPLAITSLGFFLFLAFLSGAFFIWQKGKEENFDAEPLMDSVFLAILAAFFGARILGILFSRQGNPLWFFNFFKHPGFSYFGALLGGLIFLLFFCQKQKWDFFKLMEVYVFGIVPAQILTRLGNFLDGSFYGRESNLVWAIKFPGLEKAVHPLALYEIIFLIIIFWGIKKLERQYRLLNWYKGKRGEAQPGFLFLVYLLAYAVFRFLLEFIMASSVYWKGLAVEQWLALGIIIASLILFYERSGRNGKEIKEFLSGFFGKFSIKKKEKLEVLMPAFTARKIKKKEMPFHFKAGMEAKK